MNTLKTAEFIELHRNDDTRKLALMRAKFPDVDMTYALNQIAGWQTAREKLPSWAAMAGIVYPPHISMEQCSSESTARYKADAVRRITNRHAETTSCDKSMADLTGGLGVDFSFIAPLFDKAMYVERQQLLCDMARRNFSTLGIEHAEVLCGDGLEAMKTMKPLLFAYLDPSRRDNHGQRTYALEDCTPNVIEAKELLMEKAHTVMVKLSPMIDWRKAVADLECVREVHIVAVKNECKELLVVMQRGHKQGARLFCVNDGELVEFEEKEMNTARHVIASPKDDIAVGQWLYEPNASLMKAGCFALLCERYGVKKAAPMSNLFVGDCLKDFPGRRFVITAVSSMNKKELKHLLQNVSRANIAVRNFPLTADQLRKRLCLKDGGDTYLFGTTDADGNHILVVCKKADCNGGSQNRQK